MVTLLKAAADPSRLRLLLLCAFGEFSVSELTHVMEQSQPRVSRHLKVLCDAQILERLREGCFAFYRLVGEGAVAEVVRSILRAVPTDDPVLRRDRTRLDGVIKARADRAAAYFANNAGRWDALRQLHVDDAQVEQAILAAVADAPPARVLDLGTGTGRMLTLLGPQARLGIGIDNNREMVALARAALSRSELHHCGVQQGDIGTLPFTEREFDLVVLHQVLHFSDQPDRVISEASRVLAPDGRLIIADFARHDRIELRDTDAHVWLGFADSEIRGWMTTVRLRFSILGRFAGPSLTVTLWRGTAADRANDEIT